MREMLHVAKKATHQKVIHKLLSYPQVTHKLRKVVMTGGLLCAEVRGIVLLVNQITFKRL